jgi:hypothetical protein
MHMQAFPLCAVCGDVATICHHIKPVNGKNGRPDLRLSMDNLQSLCVKHHEAIHDRFRGA